MEHNCTVSFLYKVYTVFRQH